MKLMHFFDRLEDKVRARLSRNPILYSIIGGSAIILFWRGIWHLADELETVYGLSNFEGATVSFILGAFVLLITGLFSSFFIGDAIIISGIKREKKLIEKTEEEVDQEASTLKRLQGDVSREEIILSEIKTELRAIKESVKNSENKIS